MTGSVRNPWLHPCLRCGACCAYFRVSFHWREGADVTPGGVPAAHYEDWNSTLRVMTGTMRAPVRCTALGGTIGESVACRIYEHRPSPCRELTASYEDGRVHAQCDRARAAHGLPPLSRADWLQPDEHLPTDPNAPLSPQRPPRPAA